LTTTPGEYHDFLTIYTPWVLQQATIGSAALPMSSIRELGLWADSAMVDVGPGQTVTVSLTVTGTFHVASRYTLTVDRQPTITPDAFSATLSLDSGGHLSSPTGGLALGNHNRQAKIAVSLLSDSRYSVAVSP
jgi:hypothetical protein